MVLDVFLRLILAEIPAMAREAILAIVEDMVLSGAYSVDDIHDEGCLTYSDHSNYKHCDSWFLVDVDLTFDQAVVRLSGHEDAEEYRRHIFTV